MNTKKITILACMVLAVTALHYFTAAYKVSLHLFYRELYFIPIFLAGRWGGRKTGLITSLAITFIYLPHVFILATSQFSYPHMVMGPVTDAANTTLENIFQVLVFNIIGYVSGIYTDLKRSYDNTKSQAYIPVNFQKKFLLCVEESPASLYAAKYVADIFGNMRDFGVTALWVSSSTDSERFKLTEDFNELDREHHQKGENLLDQVKEILIGGGIDESRIELRMLAREKNKKISDRILEQITGGDFDTIVVGKHQLTKSQEFLFGSVAVNLVRKASINVLTVKAPDEAEDKNIPAAN